jgi:hypothetical protein
MLTSHTVLLLPIAVGMRERVKRVVVGVLN